MTLEELSARLPEYAKDLRLNLASLERITSLSKKQVWGCAFAAASAARNPALLRAVAAKAVEWLTEEELRAARAAASIMAMNNVYYRSVHLCSDERFAQMPARLRMHVMANPGIERSDFELFSLATSAVNGCGRCLDAHAEELGGAGVTAEAVQDAIRIASVVYGVAITLEAHDTLEAA